MKQQKKRGWQAFFMTTASILVALALIEAGLRVFELPFGATWDPSEIQLGRYDEVFGWSYIPENSATQPFGSDQQMIEMHFDADGARIPAPGEGYDPEAPSVLFVGGSYTMGHGITWDETFVAQLNNRDGFPYQAVNLGVQAYGTDQSLLRLKQLMKKYNTKVVVYTFISDHIRRNAYQDRRLMLPDARFPGAKPLFEVDSQGRAVQIAYPYRFDEVSELRLWQLIRRIWVLHGPRLSFGLTEALICTMKDYAEARGARFFLLHWREGGPEIQVPCAEVIDLDDYAPPEWNDWRVPGDGHPDGRANALAAEVLAKRLTATQRQ